MNQSQLIGLVRRYVKASWDRESVRWRNTPDYFAHKAEYDGALKALALLEAAAYSQTKQPELGGEA